MKKFLIAFLMLVGCCSLLHAVGELDTTFNAGGGTPGRVEDSFFTGGTTDDGDAMLLQPDNKIVVTGRAANAGGQILFALARYNADGALDIGFNSGATAPLVPGKATVLFGTSVGDRSFYLALQNDGKIVISGQAVLDGAAANTNFGVARFNTDGTLDSTFGSAGQANVQMSATQADGGTGVFVGLQSDGKIILAGQAGTTPTALIGVTRLTTAGVLDTTFGSAGKKIVAVPGTTDPDRVAVVIVQPDDKIVVAGCYDSGVGDDAFILRLTSDGTIDTSFSGDGFVTDTFGFPGSFNRIKDLKIQSDGKMVVVGDGDDTRCVIARYNTDGSPDTSFSTDGNLVFQATGATNSTLEAIVIQPDGKHLVAGRATVGGDGNFYYRNFNSDGTTDSTFGTAGEVFDNVTGGIDVVKDIALQKDGTIVAVGSTTGSTLYAVERRLNDTALKPSKLGETMAEKYDLVNLV